MNKALLKKRMEECIELTKQGFVFDEYDPWSEKDDLRMSWWYVRREFKILFSHWNFRGFKNIMENVGTLFVAIRYFIKNCIKLIYN